MPKGRCKTCGRVYYGWSLTNREHRFCECGGAVEVVEGERKITMMIEKNKNIFNEIMKNVNGEN